jgi:hypothetical protein
MTRARADSMALVMEAPIRAEADMLSMAVPALIAQVLADSMALVVHASMAHEGADSSALRL